MAKHKERQIKIANPGERAPYTSPKRAIKYVIERRARIIGEFEIEFIADDRRHLAVLASMAGEDNSKAPARLRNSPTIDEIRLLEHISDSGFSGFGRYPMFPETAFK